MSSAVLNVCLNCVFEVSPHRRASLISSGVIILRLKEGKVGVGGGELGEGADVVPAVAEEL